MAKKTNIPPQMIGITGTHGIGKTTLAEHLAYVANDMGIKATVLGEVVRTLQNDPNFKIHGEQDIETTNLIIEKQMEAERELKNSDYDIVFCDRTIFDPLYYFFATKKYRPMFEDWLFKDKIIEGLHFDEGKIVTWLYESDARYDHIIFAEIPDSETKIEDDGFRNVDIEYQKEVQDIAEKIRRSIIFELGELMKPTKSFVKIICMALSTGAHFVHAITYFEENTKSLKIKRTPISLDIDVCEVGFILKVLAVALIECHRERISNIWRVKHSTFGHQLYFA